MNRKRKIVVVTAIGIVALILTVGVARADFVFGLPQNLGPVINSLSSEHSATSMSADGLELYLCSDRPGGFGGSDIWVSTRPSVNDPWGPPSNLGTPVNSASHEIYPCLSSDGLTLYFSDLYLGAARPGGLGGADIWVTTRPSRNAPWSTPLNVGAPINGSALDFAPTVSADGLTMFFTSNRNVGIGGWDLWTSRRASVQDAWGPPANLGPSVNSASHDCECPLSADGLALFFVSNRAGGSGTYDLWMTPRKSANDAWGPAVNLGPTVNSAWEEGSPGVSADMRMLYFTSGRPGGFGGNDLWQAPIVPIVDFDGDGMVGMGDLVRLIQSWGKNDPLVDIGPGPWGDGKVDEEDLEVLTSHWGQEVYDPSLIAHWKLDETSGTTAADSAGANGGMLIGNPVWQPVGGKIKGALLLDGIDDAITAPFVLNPATGPFSAFLWVKGGAPRQVVLSQDNGVNWLMADALKGALMTELRGSGRNGKPLPSSAVITDGAWHRVGFVWDGTDRILYVDDAEVARDTQASLTGSAGVMHIGAASTLAAGTFWSGLIDDVRIYNRAVKPTGK